MKTIICAKCNLEKSIEDFSPKKNSKTGYQKYCKPCNSEIVSEYYKKNKYKDKYAERARNYKYKCVDAIKHIKSQYTCCFCGEKDACCLDCHHVDDKEKDFEISKLISGKNIDFLLEELPKCVVICSNCHRKLHAKKIELKNPKTIQITREEWEKLVPPAPRKKQEWTQERLIKRRERDKTFKCVNCGGKCSKNASRCKSCSDVALGHIKITQEELQTDFTNLKTFSAVARKYKVSDNTVRKWCKRVNWWPENDSIVLSYTK